MKWIKNLRITKKMFLLTSITTIGLLLIGGISLWQINKLSNNIESVYHWNVVPIEIVSNMKSNQQNINTAVLELIISKDNTKKQELLSKINTEQQNIDQLRGQYNANIPVVIQMFESFDNLRKNYQNQLNDIIELTKQNKSDNAYGVYLKQLEPTAIQLMDVNSNLITFNSDYAEDFYKSNKKDALASITLQVSIIAIAIVLSVLISWVITNLIVRPVNEMKSLMLEAENGDLTVQSIYQSKDEIGVLAVSFNEMVFHLKELIKKVRESSEQVAASSEELTASAEQTNHAAEHIAESSMELATGSDSSLKGTEDASLSVREMETNIMNISESISSVSNNSKVTSLESEKGNEAIKNTIQQMNTVNESVLHSANIIKSLGVRSGEIEKIVGVISDISEQTNLLALNAAIEAARAGEHGKGFAVVADEVRKLAEESRKSADHITSLIRDIQGNTNNAVSSMEKCTEDVETGMLLVNDTGESFEKIYHSASEVSRQMEEVSASIGSITENAKSLAYHITEVSKTAEKAVLNTQNVASSAEEQLATMEEISASSDNLANMAEELQKMVISFKVTKD
ncbi:methyl-accepting chemotaxis protein [Psychrobacillus sp. L3]|uniref:methyl-accepting chemotaxis protein n=1 Tax=Psychrobacillus sp. L3 TaxID=3236891 RepID=UPI0036F2885A